MADNIEIIFLLLQLGGSVVGFVESKYSDCINDNYYKKDKELNQYANLSPVLELFNFLANEEIAVECAIRDKH